MKKINKLYKVTNTVRHISWWRVLYSDNSMDEYWHLEDMPIDLRNAAIKYIKRYLELQKEQVSQ